MEDGTSNKNTQQNDIIPALPSKPDVKIKISEPTRHNALINLKGKSIDSSVVNAIRRIIYGYIPVYGLHRSQIKIEKNTSIYTQEMVYCQLEQMPIYDIDNTYDLLSPSKYLSNKMLKDIYGIFLQDEVLDVSKVDEINIEKIKNFQIELSVNIKNDEPNIRTITSHDVVLMINGKESKNYKKEMPIGMFNLKTGEELVFKADALLGIHRIHTSWDCVSRCIHIKKSDHDYDLSYISLRQLSVESIFKKACQILSGRFSNLKTFLEKNKIPMQKNDNKNEDNDDIMIFRLYNEDDTLGNLLSTGLQRHKDILSAGYSKPHDLINEIEIAFKTKKDHQKILINVIEYYIDLFDLMIK